MEEKTLKHIIKHFISKKNPRNQKPFNVTTLNVVLWLPSNKFSQLPYTSLHLISNDIKALVEYLKNEKGVRFVVEKVNVRNGNPRGYANTKQI